MKYQRMKFNKILKDLDSEEKARLWVWLAKFDGKKFVCPKCSGESFYQHNKNQEIRECRNCHLYVRLRANTIFQNSKVPMLIWLKAICFMTQGKRGISALELKSELEMKSYRQELSMEILTPSPSNTAQQAYPMLCCHEWHNVGSVWLRSRFLGHIVDLPGSRQKNPGNFPGPWSRPVLEEPPPGGGLG